LRDRSQFPALEFDRLEDVLVRKRWAVRAGGGFAARLSGGENRDGREQDRGEND
jgi:hypothetical protein